MTSGKAGGFFFINKTETSSNLSRGSSEEQAAIQRYVQTGRKRYRPSRKSSHNSSAGSKAGTEHKQPREDVRQVWNHSANPAHERDQRDTTNPSLDLVELPGPAASDQIRGLTSPWQSGLGGLDPFNASSVRLDGTVKDLLHYYVHYYHPTLWPNEMVVMKYGLYTFHDAVQATLRMAVANPLAMYCLLSAAVCRMQHIDRLTAGKSTTRESFYMYKATGLMASSIQSERSEGDLRQILTCVMFLLSAEAYRDNVPAATMHMQAVYRLVEPIGGLAAVRDESLQNQLAMSDLFLACVRMEPCLSEPFYDPGPPASVQLQAHELYPRSEQLSKMGSSLSATENVVSIEISELAEQLIESYSIKNRINTAAIAVERVLEITHWVTTRNMAIRNRLLSLALPTPAPQALRMAIIMWSLLVMNVTGRTKTVKTMAPRLVSTLRSTQATDWTGAPHIHLWILILGHHCAAEGSASSEWLALQCRLHADCLLPGSAAPDGSADCEEQLSSRLEAFQASFFFDEEIQRSRTRDLARRMLHIV